MASSSKLVVALLSLCLFSSSMSMAMARPLIISTKSTPLLTRLKLDEEEGSTSTNPSCWDSLFELQSCTGEVVLFFLNGQTYLGPNCCQAIRTIENHCWPSMLGSIGIDTQEGDVLLGYCDAATNSPGSPLPPSSPVPVHSNNVTATP